MLIRHRWIREEYRGRKSQDAFFLQEGAAAMALISHHQMLPNTSRTSHFSRWMSKGKKITFMASFTFNNSRPRSVLSHPFSNPGTRVKKHWVRLVLHLEISGHHAQPINPHVAALQSDKRSCYQGCDLTNPPEQQHQDTKIPYTHSSST